jgi:hypothetical protein
MRSTAAAALMSGGTGTEEPAVLVQHRAAGTEGPKKLRGSLGDLILRAIIMSNIRVITWAVIISVWTLVTM